MVAARGGDYCDIAGAWDLSEAIFGQKQLARVGDPVHIHFFVATHVVGNCFFDTGGPEGLAGRRWETRPEPQGSGH